MHSASGNPMFGKKKDADIQKDAEAYVKAKHEGIVKKVKSTFDATGWQYTFRLEDDVIITRFMGDDLPINLAIKNCVR